MTQVCESVPTWNDYGQWYQWVQKGSGSAGDDALCFFDERANALIATARKVPISGAPKSHGERFWAMVLQAKKNERGGSRGAIVPYEAFLELAHAAGKKTPSDKQKRESALKALADLEKLVKWIGLACKPDSNGTLYAIEGGRRFYELFDAARIAYNVVIPRSTDNAALSTIAGALMSLRGTGYIRREDLHIRLDANEYKKLQRGVELMRFDLNPIESIHTRPSNHVGRPPKSEPDKYDLVIRRMIDNGDVEREGRSWKKLLIRYASELPKDCTADRLRKRVEREEFRRQADKN